MAEESKVDLWFDEGTGTVLAKTAIVARFFGVTSQTLSNWVKDGCPRHSYGVYDLRQVQEYRNRVQYGISQSDPQADTNKMTTAELKVFYEQKLKAAQAEAAEHKNRQLVGEFLDRKEVVAQLRTFFGVFRRSAEGLSGQLMLEVSHLVPVEDQRQLQHHLDETIGQALEQMSVDGVYHACD